MKGAKLRLSASLIDSLVLNVSSRSVNWLVKLNSVINWHNFELACVHAFA